MLNLLNFFEVFQILAQTGFIYGLYNINLPETFLKLLTIYDFVVDIFPGDVNQSLTTTISSLMYKGNYTSHTFSSGPVTAIHKAWFALVMLNERAPQITDL